MVYLEVGSHLYQSVVADMHLVGMVQALEPKVIDTFTIDPLT